MIKIRSTWRPRLKMWNYDSAKLEGVIRCSLRPLRIQIVDTEYTMRGMSIQFGIVASTRTRIIVIV